MEALHAHGRICEQGELLGISGGLSHSEVNAELLRKRDHWLSVWGVGRGGELSSEETSGVAENL